VGKRITLNPWPFISDIAVFVLKSDVKHQSTNQPVNVSCFSKNPSKQEPQVVKGDWVVDEDDYKTYGFYISLKALQTRMWANAQRASRPAEHRWRPLFNAAVWLTPTT